MTGVSFSKNGQSFTAKANAEVILCAGAVGTPQILQRSGIGPGAVLAEAGVEAIVDLPGVGANLQDHLQQRAIYKVSGTRTLNQSYYALFGKASMGLDYIFRRRGPLTMAPSQLGIFTRSDPDRERANIQFHVQPLSLDKFGDPLHRFLRSLLQRVTSLQHRAEIFVFPRVSRKLPPLSIRIIWTPRKTAVSRRTQSVSRDG